MVWQHFYNQLYNVREWMKNTQMRAYRFFNITDDVLKVIPRRKTRNETNESQGYHTFFFFFYFATAAAAYRLFFRRIRTRAWALAPNPNTRCNRDVILTCYTRRYKPVVCDESFNFFHFFFICLCIFSKCKDHIELNEIL